MGLVFKQLECINVPDSVKKEAENDPDHVLKKLRTALNLCWELPQVVMDRLFSATLVPIQDADREKLETALSTLTDIKNSDFEAAKYFAFPRFRSNVCLKILTAFVKEARTFVALFATEARNSEGDFDRILPAGIDLPFAYAVKLSPDDREVIFYVSTGTGDPEIMLSASAFGLTSGWLQYGVAKKISSWLNNPEFEVAPSGKPRSMRLADPEVYLSTYLTLKESIGAYWIKNWPERTDPQKFVFEELAIASYLITILRQNKTTNATFADLGCGNGFLTFALNNAKFADISISGVGIDARKRKIWDIYATEMSGKLIEAPVSADNLEVFSGSEWFVGNHSDELTPWIPYIASKCGPNAKVFLLPCCPFDFHSKYKFRTAGKSLYGGYLDYIERICTLCGFEVERDRLRIPSTKRVCFVCSKRANLPDEIVEKNRRELAELVQEKAALEDKDKIDPLLPKAPEVRNCTSISFDLKQQIMGELFDLLINKCSEDVKVIKLENGAEWRAGGRLPLQKAIESLSAKSIDALKNQDGGLKTFAKNYSHVFAVISGSVYFKPHPTATQFFATARSRSKKPAKSSLLVKPPLPPLSLSATSKPSPSCWFELLHPDGCPYWPVCNSRHNKNNNQ